MTVRLFAPVPGFEKELLDVAEIFLGTARRAGAEGPAELEITIRESACGPVRRCEARLSGAMDAAFQSEGAFGGDPQEEKRLRKRQQKLALFGAFVQATGRRPPWGSLTGVRPTRLVAEGIAEGLTPGQAAERVKNLFGLSPGKAALLEETVRVQQGLPTAGENGIAFYIGIPFCTSRCRYCSFFSREAGDPDILRRYVQALGLEIADTERLIREQGYTVRSLYVGGGTPTSLPADLLGDLMRSASGLIRQARETTVEAGRPDTITADKLRVIRDFGGTRISVNPQTMHDPTLERIGRRHTRRQTEDAYALARRMGMGSINMDLIAGLPGETGEMFSQTLSWALAMRPESITVHALSMKRSSQMHRDGDGLPDARLAEGMLEEAGARLQAGGYRPYYLYRQKHTAGNLENVGYALPGHECLYNLDMMEDRTTVLACGAGAVSKRVWPGGRRILRAGNTADVEGYVHRVREMAEKKHALMRGVGKGVKPASAAGEQADVLALELENEA